MTQGDSPWKKFRYVLQTIVVGIFAQVAWCVVMLFPSLLLRDMFRENGNYAGLLLAPIFPGMYIALELLGARTREDPRVLLAGLLLNSLIYTVLWLVGRPAFRRWREWRREATRLTTLMEPPPSASAPIEDRRDSTTQTTSSRNRLRHAAKILLYVGVLGQIALLVLLYAVAILRGGTLWETRTGIPLPLLPGGPAMVLPAVLGPSWMMGARPFFVVGYVFNSLVYTAAWLVCAWAIRGLRRPRQNGSGSG